MSWLMTTGLRPWLAPLAEDERAAYLTRYRELLRGAYPEQADGMVLMRFPRLFLVGVR